MDVGHAEYCYTVELAALEERFRLSMEQADRLLEKAKNRRDGTGAFRINKLRRSIDLVQRRIAQWKEAGSN
jgi:hypothetical protein